MSNSNSEFIAAWNDIFAFKIVESDLSKPNEKFVFNALNSYLLQFNIDITNLIETEGGDLSFKIKFCGYIDHFYKISDKSNSFVYYDLIKPSPKKTAHMLKYLLNYWLYYNMMKGEIVTLAHAKINEHSKLMENKKNFLTENDKLEVKAKTIDKSIDEYGSLLPKLNLQIENLKVEENIQLEKIKELQDKCKKFDSTLADLRNSEEELKNSIVSQDEVDSLKANEESLKKALSDLEEVESVTLVSNQERSSLINKLQPLIKKIESTMEMYPADELISSKEIKSKWTEIKQKHSSQVSVNDKKTIEIETYSSKEDELKKTYNNKLKVLQGTVDTIKQNIAEAETNVETESRLIETLEITLQNVEEGISETQSNREYILKMAEKMIELF